MSVPRPRPVTVCACGDHAFARTTRWGVALVSAIDAPVLQRGAWAMSKRCYVTNNDEYLHHAVRRRNSETDHRDGNRLDCRRPNLRGATRKQNARNVRRHADSSGRFKGVYRLPSGRWNAKVCVDGRSINIGTFDTDVEAARAYDRRAKRVHGRWARLNYPDGVRL